MTDSLDRLTAALADRYVIERELGAGSGAFMHYYMTFSAFHPIRGDPRFQRLFEETAP